MFTRHLFGTALALCIALGIAGTSIADTPLTAAGQQYNNQQWKQAAIAQQNKLIQDGDNFLKNRDYNRAKECYRQAQNISYMQWDIVGNQVSNHTVQVTLDTPNTAKARQKLETMDATIKKDSQDDWKTQATALMKQADAALQQKNPARAYAICGQVLGAAERAPDLKDTATVTLAQKKQQDILKGADAILDDAEKFLAGAKMTDAVAKLNEFLTTYPDLQSLVPDLKARVQKLSTDPAMTKEVNEQAVRKEIALGDTALAREDYISALRRYRTAASLHPDTDAAQQATNKIAQLQNDPKAIEGLKKQEAEGKARMLYLQAETLRAQDNDAEAAALYQQIVKDYPDSSYVARAKEALVQLVPQPAPATPAATPPANGDAPAK